jgi:hypothetical protein
MFYSTIPLIRYLPTQIKIPTYHHRSLLAIHDIVEFIYKFYLLIIVGRAIHHN